MADLTPVFLEPVFPVYPLHVLGETCWCHPVIHTADDNDIDCTCEYCLDCSPEDEE